ncbi:hypothetical protein CVO77_09140 [Sphingopyxis lindanitolerans]|uniref:Uncharacterized protein n=1 Tax=Sphingopyxis lindanitolerans TaxID=2054227 RepID=A0A2S8B8B9_9SPHN|nr:hypothetical protein [Sphingopyxis lindanitolerans]PQM28597.1 hypothetical protein CVO77_09140 [Sphingopyxis lindanitolerans]
MFMTILAFLGVIGAQPAPVAADSPVASARLVSQDQFQLRWHGVGDLRASAQLCVSSSTGRFQLDIQPMSTSFGTSEAPPFEIAISTRAGDRLVQPAKATGFTTFEGRVLPDDCMGTGNVTIELRFQQSGLTEAIAGAYLERIHLSVRPL